MALLRGGVLVRADFRVCGAAMKGWYLEMAGSFNSGLMHFTYGINPEACGAALRSAYGKDISDGAFSLASPFPLINGYIVDQFERIIRYLAAHITANDVRILDRPIARMKRLKFVNGLLNPAPHVVKFMACAQPDLDPWDITDETVFATYPHVEESREVHVAGITYEFDIHPNDVASTAYNTDADVISNAVITIHLHVQGA